MSGIKGNIVDGEFHSEAEKNGADVKEMAGKIYELCVENKMAYADYAHLIFEMNRIKEDIARINREQFNRQMLVRL